MTRIAPGWGYEQYLREHMPEVKYGEYEAVKEAQAHKQYYQEKLARAEKGEVVESLNKDLYRNEIMKADMVLDKRHWEYEKDCNRRGIDHLEKEDYIAAVLLTD